MQTCKPDSVSSLNLDKILIIYLVALLPTKSICLPLSNERVALNCWYTWHFTA